MGAKNSIDLDTDPRSIIASRLLDAPCELVFLAFTEPRYLAQWWGPNGFTTTTHSFDFRPGGVWRFVMHGPDRRDYQNRITYEEIVRPERIAYRHDGGDDVEPVQFTQTLTFEDQRPHAAYMARTIPVSGRAHPCNQDLQRRQRSVANHGTASRLRRGNGSGEDFIMVLRSRQRTQRHAQIACAADQLFDLRMRIFPDRISLGQQRPSGRGQGETPATAIFLVDRNFQKSTTFEGFEIGRESRSVHREKKRDAAKRRRLRPVERHQQRELPISEIEWPQYVVETARQRTGRAVNMQAQAIVTHQVRSGERQLNIFHDGV